MAGPSFDQRDGVIWMDGNIVPWGEAKLHVLSHGLHYGSSVFEGERAYGGKIFKSREHALRFRTSAHILDFEIPYSVEHLMAAKAEVIRRNGLSNCYIRPVAWRGSEMMAVSSPNSTIHVAICAWDWPSMFDMASKMNGIRLDIADYRRPDPATAPSDAKASGLYMICTISKHRAERKGYADAMMLDWQGRVAECTAANILFTQGDRIITPIADCFLNGITRQTILGLAGNLGFEVVERRIMPEELADFDECLICGSGAEVTPVSEVGPYAFTPGKISKALIEAYAAAVNA